ncbi:unnamed protein product [Prunus armeniaca]
MTAPTKTSVVAINGESNLVTGAGCSAKRIIGCGTKKMRLYYMNDIAPGRVQVRSVVREKHKKIWLWHRRFGHCETCILAKHMS